MLQCQEQVFSPRHVVTDKLLRLASQLLNHFKSNNVRSHTLQLKIKQCAVSQVNSLASEKYSMQFLLAILATVCVSLLT